MTTPMLMTQHPAEELLAAFVDDRLDSAASEPVTEHLASCGECREIVLMSTAFQASEKTVAQVVSEDLPARADAAPAGQAVTVFDRGAVAARSGETLLVRENHDRRVSVHRFGARMRKAAIGSFAAAAAIAVMVVRPISLFGPNIDHLVAASQTLKTRPSAGRLAGGFAYSKEPSTMRGSADEGREDLVPKATLIQYRIDLEESKFPDPHTLGLTKLLTAEEGANDRSGAVTLLETARDKARGKERDSIEIDLAAALIAYAQWSGQPEANYRRALDLSNEVLNRQPKSPEALWNRAMALQSLDRDGEALKAWNDYLKVDSNSRWAEEARQHQSGIESGF